MYGNDVRAFKKFIQGNAGVILAVPGTGGGIIDDIHPEGFADGCDFLADGTHAHNSQRFAGCLGEGVVKVHVHGTVAVGAATDKLLIVEGTSEKIEDVHPGRLGNGVGGIGRHISDSNSPRITQRDIDVIDASTSLADELELWSGIQKGLVYDYLIEKGYICIFHSFTGFFCRRKRVTNKFTQRGNFIQGNASHRY